MGHDSGWQSAEPDYTSEQSDITIGQYDLPEPDFGAPPDPPTPWQSATPDYTSEQSDITLGDYDLPEPDFGRPPTPYQGTHLDEFGS